MSKRKRKSPRKADHSTTKHGSESDPSGEGPSTVQSSRYTGGFKEWVRHNRSDLRFLLIFGSCMLLYYLATLTSPIKERFFPSYLRWNASVSGSILDTIGQDVVVEGKSIRQSDGASIQVERGCDAVAPSALFVSAVLASPVGWISRLVAAVVGSLALMVLNLVRVCSLFLIRVHFPKAFDVMHLDVWQALFIFMALLFWALWASRASKKAKLVHATP